MNSMDPDHSDIERADCSAIALCIYIYKMLQYNESKLVFAIYIYMMLSVRTPGIK